MTQQITYKKLINDYRKGFSTLKTAKKYIPGNWQILIMIEFIATISIAVSVIITRSYFLLAVYLILLTLLVIQINRRSKSVGLLRNNQYQHLLFIHFISSRVNIYKDNPRESINNLYTISNSHLSRRRPSIIFSGILTTLLISPTLGFVPSLITSENIDFLTLLLILLILIMLFGIGLMITSTLYYLIDRKYDKEIEFRDRIENLILNYNKKDWDQ